MANVIRNIRGGSAKWNEEDRINLATILAKAGYTVKIDYRPVPGDTKNRKEHVVVYEEQVRIKVKGYKFVREETVD